MPPRHTASVPTQPPPLGPPPPRDAPKPPRLAPTSKLRPSPPKAPPPPGVLLLASKARQAKAHVLSLGREELTFARLSCAGEFHFPSSLSVRELFEQAPGLSRTPFPPQPPPPPAVPRPNFANAHAFFAQRAAEDEAAAQQQAENAAGPPIMYLFHPGEIHISMFDSWRQAWVKLEGWLSNSNVDM